MSVFPHDRLKITCTSADKQGRFHQFYSAEISPEIWERELAARADILFLRRRSNISSKAASSKAAAWKCGGDSR